MSRVDVSLVIVNWNTKNLLIDCIYSLIKTTRIYSYEIIVVDNGSTDGSVPAVRNYFPQVKIIENSENLGFSKANNIGLKIASGRYCCLVNSDIIALDKSLDSMIEYLDSNPDIGAIGPLTYDQYIQYRPNCREFPSLIALFTDSFYLDKVFPFVPLFKSRLMSNLSHSKPSEVDVLSGCFFCFNHDLLKTVGYLDESFFIYGEDKDFCMRIKNLGYGVKFFPIAKVIHVAGASSSSDPIRFKKELLKSEFIYWKKHFNQWRFKIFIGTKILVYSLKSIIFFCASILTTKKASYASLSNENIVLLKNFLRFISRYP